MYYSHTQKNISSLYTWIFPIIIVSKIVRWTVMYAKLVAMSIGNGIADRINHGFYQGINIAAISQATSGASIAEHNTGVLFGWFNFFGIHTTLGWEIYITIVFNIFIMMVTIDFYKRTPMASTLENIFIYVGIAILNIFCLNLAKEPYQMIFFFFMAWAIRSGNGYKSKSIRLTIALIATILLARKYYALVLFYYFIINYIVRHLFENIDFTTKQGLKKLAINAIGVAGFMGFFYLIVVSFFAAENEDAYQGMVTANYRSTITAFVSDSEITPIFPPGNPIFMAIDYTIKIFRLLFPLELLLRGKVTYIFLIVFQLLLVKFIVKAFISNQQDVEDEMAEEMEEDEEEDESIEKIEEKDDEDEIEKIEDEEDEEDEEEDDDKDEYEIAKRQDRKDIRRCALYLYLAFLLCSACFEPDFGSWIRHQGVTFPVLILLL